MKQNATLMRHRTQIEAAIIATHTRTAAKPLHELTDTERLASCYEYFVCAYLHDHQEPVTPETRLDIASAAHRAAKFVKASHEPVLTGGGLLVDLDGLGLDIHLTAIVSAVVSSIERKRWGELA